jgi:hypothetical protein
MRVIFYVTEEFLVDKPFLRNLIKLLVFELPGKLELQMINTDQN